jgi:hypothetical protein
MKDQERREGKIECNPGEGIVGGCWDLQKKNLK